MGLATPETILLAALLDSPAIVHAFVLHDMSWQTAAVRYLIAVPVAAIMISVLHKVTQNYGRSERTIHARSERLDEAEPPGEEEKPG